MSISAQETAVSVSCLATATPRQVHQPRPPPTPPVVYKFLSLLSLVTIQTVVGVVYKLSQKNSKYEFNTAAAITLAEVIKFCLSSMFLLRNHKWDFAASLKQVRSEMSSTEGWKLITFLAFLYAVNNQIGFVANLLMDPATIYLAKSTNTFFAMLLQGCVFGILHAQSQRHRRRRSN